MELILKLTFAMAMIVQQRVHKLAIQKFSWLKLRKEKNIELNLAILTQLLV